jgi:2-methylcitrate dehydratase PrpD
MARVTVGSDPRCDEIYPNQFPAILTVTTHDGTELVESVLVNRGGPQNPLTDAELARKFRDNAGRAYGETRVTAIEETVAALGAGTAVSELGALLVP